MSENTNAKRAVIVKTAIRLFTERGFYGTPTSMIAQESGVSNGTLFRYFPTKEMLINSVYYEIKGQMGRGLSMGVNDETTIEDKARRIWGNLVRWGVNNPNDFMFIEQFSASPFITKIPEEEVVKDYALIVEVFNEAIKKGPLKDTDTSVAFIMIFFAAKGIMKSIIDSKGKMDVDQSIDQSFRLICKGILSE
jgi:AcrR family transcriptional regulator